MNRFKVVAMLVMICFMGLFTCEIARAQRTITNEGPKSPEEIAREADISLQEGKFEKALSLYSTLLDQNEDDPKLNFLIGFCYLNTDYGLEQAIKHLKTAIDNTSSTHEKELPVEAYYYLAKSYHLNNQFNEALEIINLLMGKISPADKIFIDNVITLKKNCENAVMLSQTSAKLNIENIFELNSKYSDKNPMFFNHGNEVIFTSRRENALQRKKLEDDQYDENIFYSKLYEEEWQVPYGLSNSVNSSEHEKACWISKDGKQIIFRRLDKKKEILLQSTKNADNEWSVPLPFPEQINNRGSQSFGSLSPDGNYLFFTSDRKGGFGGTDIYICENKGNGEWGIPENLGDKINTPFNEESPVLQENGVLFFCSEGHGSMGGFDIYATYRNKKGEWLAPFNLGLPLNSNEDDFFYLPDENGMVSFISSQRQGTKGKSDIYKVTQIDSLSDGFAIISGKIVSNKKIDFVKAIDISVNNRNDKEKTYLLRTSAEGIFNYILPANANYSMTVKFYNETIYACQFDIEAGNSFLCLDQSLNLPEIKFELDSTNKIKDLRNLSGKEMLVYHSVNKTTEKIKNAYLLARIKTQNSDSLLVENSNLSKNFASDSIYSIKIAVSKSRISISNFNTNQKVKEIIDSKGNYVYYVGEFNYEWEALIQLKQLKESYPDASIFVNHSTSN
ncbi:MAG: hypothetical protein U0W24_01085 [Bacteroidales bacterium]